MVQRLPVQCSGATVAPPHRSGGARCPLGKRFYIALATANRQRIYRRTYYTNTPGPFVMNLFILRWKPIVPTWLLRRRRVGQNPQKCKETSNLMWFSLIWFILVLLVCWNLFCTIANLRIKCVTETKNVSVCAPWARSIKNVKKPQSQISVWVMSKSLTWLDFC